MSFISCRIEEVGNTVYRFAIDHDARVSDACRLIRSEFFLPYDCELEVSVFDSRLSPYDRLFDYIESDDILDFKFIGRKIEHKQILEREHLNEDEFRVFTTMTIESMMKGDKLTIAGLDGLNEGDFRKRIEEFVRRKFRALPGDAVLEIYFPGGAPIVKAFREFHYSFPDCLRHLYVVCSRKIDVQKLDHRPEKICYIKGDMTSLLSPLCDSTEIGLCEIASILGYFAYGGQLCGEIIDGLRKYVPFAPLITGLYLLDQNQGQQQHLNGRIIVNVCASLHTIFRDIAETDNYRAFEHGIKVLGYFSSCPTSVVPPCTVFHSPYLPVGFEGYFHDYKKSNVVCMMDSDFRGTDSIQFDYNRSQIVKFDQPFHLVPIYSARGKATACVIQLERNVGLLVSSTAAKEAGGKDKLNIIDPRNGEMRAYLPEDMAEQFDAADIHGIVESNEVREAIMICLDCSASMRDDWGRIIRLDGAKGIFKSFVEAAFAARVYNLYGVLQITNHPISGVSSDLIVRPTAFTSEVQKLRAYGGTPLFATISRAADILIQKRVEVRNPQLLLRIIALTDGEASPEKISPQEVERKLKDNDIHLDAIFISDEIAWDLAALAVATGGSILFPKTVDEARQKWFSGEPLFFNSRLRKFRAKDDFQTLFKGFNVNPNIEQYTQLKRSDYVRNQNTPMRNPGFVAQSLKHGRTTQEERILEEIKMLGTINEEWYEVWVDSTNISKWTVLINGFAENIYSSLDSVPQWWRLDISFPDGYPEDAPEIHFVGAPYHPNISEAGAIFCPSIQWYYNHTMHVFELLWEVRLLFMFPDTNHCITEDRRVKFGGNALPQREIEDAVRRFSKASSAEIRSIWKTEECKLDKKDYVYPIPRQFLCPIGETIMHEPVLASTGVFYDKPALESRLRLDPMFQCPITRKTFSTDPNQRTVKDDMRLTVDIKMALTIQKYLDDRVGWYSHSRDQIKGAD